VNKTSLSLFFGMGLGSFLSSPRFAVIIFFSPTFSTVRAFFSFERFLYGPKLGLRLFAFRSSRSIYVCMRSKARVYRYRLLSPTNLRATFHFPPSAPSLGYRAFSGSVGIFNFCSVGDLFLHFWRQRGRTFPPVLLLIEASGCLTPFARYVPRITTEPRDFFSRFPDREYVESPM